MSNINMYKHRKNMNKAQKNICSRLSIFLVFRVFDCVLIQTIFLECMDIFTTSHINLRTYKNYLVEELTSEKEQNNSFFSVWNNRTTKTPTFEPSYPSHTHYFSNLPWVWENPRKLFKNPQEVWAVVWDFCGVFRVLKNV